jgi:hypothetical protein
MPRSSHSFLFYCLNNTGEEYKLLSSSSYYFIQSPSRITHLDTNIFLSNLFSKTLKPSSNPYVRNKVSHAYKQFLMRKFKKN